MIDVTLFIWNYCIVLDWAQGETGSSEQRSWCLKTKTLWHGEIPSSSPTMPPSVSSTCSQTLGNAWQWITDWRGFPLIFRRGQEFDFRLAGPWTGHCLRTAGISNVVSQYQRSWADELIKQRAYWFSILWSRRCISPVHASWGSGARKNNANSKKVVHCTSVLLAVP